MMTHRPCLVRRVAIAICCLAAAGAKAQQVLPPAAPAPPAPAQQFQPSGDWEKLPKMTIERQFSGPLRDTVIQRLRDPVDRTICYLYLPISAPHSPVQSNGFVQYGGNTIGSINCLPPQRPPAAAPRRP